MKVFCTVKEEYDKWDILVTKAIAERLMKNGLDGEKSFVFKVHKRNFEKRGGDGERRGRGGRGGGRGRGDRDRGDRGERG